MQAAQKELESSAEVAGRAHQAARLDAKLLEVEEEVDNEGSKIVGEILGDLLTSVLETSSLEREEAKEEVDPKEERR